MYLCQPRASIACELVKKIGDVNPKWIYRLLSSVQ